MAYADLHCVKMLRMDDGACVRVFGSTAGEAGVEPERCAQPIGVALNQPRSIALDDPRSVLFIADSWNHRVVVVDIRCGNPAHAHTHTHTHTHTGLNAVISAHQNTAI